MSACIKIASNGNMVKDVTKIIHQIRHVLVEGVTTPKYLTTNILPVYLYQRERENKSWEDGYR